MPCRKCKGVSGENTPMINIWQDLPDSKMIRKEWVPLFTFCLLESPWENLSTGRKAYTHPMHLLYNVCSSSNNALHANTFEEREE